MNFVNQSTAAATTAVDIPQQAEINFSAALHSQPPSFFSILFVDHKMCLAAAVTSAASAFSCVSFGFRRLSAELEFSGVHKFKF